MLEKFKMTTANAQLTPIRTDIKYELPLTDYVCLNEQRKWYQSAVGLLMYGMLGTRPDLAYAVSVASRFCYNPTKQHAELVQRIFRYIKGSVNRALEFDGTDLFGGYTDAKFVGDPFTSKSVGGYIFMLGGSAISWSSKKQTTVALSTAEAEYTALYYAGKEAAWLKDMLTYFGLLHGSNPVLIYVDNQSAIAIAKNPKHHNRTKHIRVQFYFIRQLIEDEQVEVQHIPGIYQVADILTKALALGEFNRQSSALGMITTAID
ncbi:unnamed protein product [Zymoseptoria tritici ST99CH_3D7]|uniref:Reverse transcriptase Ty1/copia-type domain-containing protein n=1 Tax=Zymoseptoria tritici (strain ST99CH_3D7) TaxID=1276538 RepID=A0A1X7RQJ8_ZYMT9|nr:unnamed protein product [Zymoseptoria tritici ST99CH_3D7]